MNHATNWSCSLHMMKWAPVRQHIVLFKKITATFWYVKYHKFTGCRIMWLPVLDVLVLFSPIMSSMHTAGIMHVATLHWELKRAQYRKTLYWMIFLWQIKEHIELGWCLDMFSPCIGIGIPTFQFTLYRNGISHFIEKFKWLTFSLLENIVTPNRRYVWIWRTKTGWKRNQKLPIQGSFVK